MRSVNFCLSRLSNLAVSNIEFSATRLYFDSPRLGSLIGLTMAFEMERRIAERDDNQPHEPGTLRIPPCWSAGEITLAKLTLMTMAEDLHGDQTATDFLVAVYDALAGKRRRANTCP